MRWDGMGTISFLFLHAFYGMVGMGKLKVARLHAPVPNVVHVGKIIAHSHMPLRKRQACKILFASLHMPPNHTPGHAHIQNILLTCPPQRHISTPSMRKHKTKISHAIRSLSSSKTIGITWRTATIRMLLKKYRNYRRLYALQSKKSSRSSASLQNCGLAHIELRYIYFPIPK